MLRKFPHGRTAEISSTERNPLQSWQTHWRFRKRSFRLFQPLPQRQTRKRAKLRLPCRCSSSPCRPKYLSPTLLIDHAPQEAYFKKKGCTFTDPPPGTRADDTTNDDLSIAPTAYASGWCGIHVTQYQKNEPGDSPTSNNPEYQLSVCVFDANKVLLNELPGSTTGDCGTFVALNGQAQVVSQSSAHRCRLLSVPPNLFLLLGYFVQTMFWNDADIACGQIDTALPGLLYVTAGAVDSDPVNFNYQDQAWGSNDQPHHSNFGAYDSGKREGDTGFSC